jgi:toxin FitB
MVDADVLSEPTKPAPDTQVVDWLRRNEPDLAVNPIVLGELEYGILLLAAGRRRTLLEKWFASSVHRLRVLDFDTATAAAWARLLAELKKKGRSMPIKDSLVAASAVAHGLTVATRNTVDFRNANVTVTNPFAHEPPGSG